jgi:signal transduction histidine kinase
VDVPVDRPSYRLSWDLYFVVGYLAVLLLAGLDQDAGAGARTGASLTITVLAAWYAGFGRRVILAGDSPARARLFVAGVTILFCVSIGFTRMTQPALFALCPMVGLTLPLRQALPVQAVLNLAPAVIRAVLASSVDEFLMLLPISMFGFGFAWLASIYIERITGESEQRARLITELEHSRAEVGRLSHAAGVAAERERLAGEIHDTLAQGFTSIVTLLQAAESGLGRDEEQVRHRLDLAIRTARENLAEARALVRAGGPEALETGSLDEAVRRLAERTGEQLGVPAEFHRAGAGLPLPTGVEVVLLRAAQEALSNVCKHAKASEVAVRLSYEDSVVRLLVRDDGVGFVHNGQASGFGLPGMRKRVEQVGGALRIATAPGAGTEIRVEVPV